MQSSQSVDQRRKTDMEDPAAMTIEFLRARLLSERSVSRVARQRADELAKRVAELEEQLKIATLQRKKAEKATAGVLAILENNEINDLSKALDLTSDHNRILLETEEDNNSTKEAENSASSRPMTNQAEGLSGSEIEISLSGRSLSWKSCSDSPDFLKKKIDIDKDRRRCCFLSTSGSTKARTGKSCRKIKRRETISAVDDVRDEFFVPDAQENGVDALSGNDSGLFEDKLQILNEFSGKQEDKVYAEGFASCAIEEKIKETNSGLDINVSGRVVNLERALEDQAQLIDQYEAEETAQREWEEKFKENKSHTPDSSEHGNQSDITEERDEIRKTSGSLDIVPFHAEGAKLEGCHIGQETNARTLPNGFIPATCVGMGCSEDQQCNSFQVSKAETTTSPEFSFQCQGNLGPTIKGKQKQDLSDTPASTVLHSDPQPIKEASPFHEGKQLCNGESSGSQNRLQMALFHEPPKRLGDVLEALQNAKSSLKHELNRLPLSRQTWSAIRMSETPLPAISSGEDMDIPFGCVGLFRVPTDMQMDATARTNLLGAHSDFGSSLSKYHSNMDVAGTDLPLEATMQANVLGARSDHMDSGLNLTKFHPSSPYLDMGLRNSSLKSDFDPCLDMGMALPGSAKYLCPSYAYLVPRMPSNGELPRSLTSIRPQMPAGDRYSVFNKEISRSKMLN